jgi:ribonucleoside-diphosphate reductase alpha chain
MSKKKLSYDEALAQALDFYDGEELPATTILNKYARKDKDGNYLEATPDDILKRVAKELGKVTPKLKTETAKRIFGKEYDPKIHSNWEDIYFRTFNGLKGVCPQGSILSAIGITESPQSLSNCFVIDSPKDSINGILLSSEQEAQLMKRRGGVGMDLSNLRPVGAPVSNAARTSTGAVGWMDHFSNVCRSIGQSGRRGALMLTLDVKHPDALGFAEAKKNLKYCTGANVSLKITDEFMKCVLSDRKYTQQWPVESSDPEITQDINAKELWNQITDCAWEMAEPGILMWDNATKNLPADFYSEFKTLSCNPCAEIFLSAYDSCRLMTICLINYVEFAFTDKARFDFKKFERDVRVAMQAMDAVVTAEIQHVDRIIKKIRSEMRTAPKDDKDSYKVELKLWQKIKRAAELGRRTGLGTHGLGDCLCQLQIRYDSDEALKVIDKIYKLFRDVAYDESVEMAKEYGPFPIFDYETEKHCDFIKRLPKQLKEKIKKYGRRNIAKLTNAPTGTISLGSQVSSGIEPTYSQVSIRRRKINDNDPDTRVDFIDDIGDKWMHFGQLEQNVKRYLKVAGVDLDVTTITSEEQLDEILPPYFTTAAKIDWKKRIEVQSTIQKYLDHSISSTLNLPESISKEEVNEIYTYAYKKKLKGVTIYRQGCRTGVLISADESKKDKFPVRPEGVTRVEAPKRPKKLPCEVHFTKVKGEEYIVIVGLLNGSVYEVFFGKYGNQIPHKHFSGWVEKKKKGQYLLNYISGTEVVEIDVNKYFDNKDYAAATRMLSMSLRHGSPLEYVIEQLQKSSSSITEFGSAVSRVLKKYIKIEDLQARYKQTHGENIEVRVEDGCVTIVNLDTGEVDSKCG